MNTLEIKKCNFEQIIADRKWLDEFYKLFPDDAAWNLCGNGWLNMQYQSGKTPEQVFTQCHTHGL